MEKTKKKVEVDNIEGQRVFLDPLSERYFIERKDADVEYFDTLRAAKAFILRQKEQEFSGDFYIKDSWDGIKEFVAKRKIFDDYDRVYKIIGDKRPSVGNSRVEVEEKDLFPMSKENIALYDRARKMDRAGWKMIQDAKSLQHELKKAPTK